MLTRVDAQQEVVGLNALRHENVLPLLGVAVGGESPAIVSPWMKNGNINHFIKAKGRDVHRFKLVGLVPVLHQNCRLYCTPIAQGSC